MDSPLVTHHHHQGQVENEQVKEHNLQALVGPDHPAPDPSISLHSLHGLTHWRPATACSDVEANATVCSQPQHNPLGYELGLNTGDRESITPLSRSLVRSKSFMSYRTN